VRIAGPEHGDRLPVHDVSKVVGRRLQHDIIEGQLAFEILQVVAQRLRAGRISARRLQHEECRTAREPFAEVATRDIPLHGSPPWCGEFEVWAKVACPRSVARPRVP